METPTEDKDCWKLFFTNINKMLQEKICEDQNIESSSYIFNPYHFKDDGHDGKQNWNVRCIWRSICKRTYFKL